MRFCFFFLLRAVVVVFLALGIGVTVGITMMLLVHAFVQPFGFLKGVLVARNRGKNEGGGAEQNRSGFHGGS